MTTGELIQSTVSNPEEARDALLRSAANQRAGADPLPGPAASAFCSGNIQIGDKTVYRIVPRHWAALRAIESPLLSIIQDVIQIGKVDTEITDEDANNLCWIFTHTGPELKVMLDAKGAKGIKEAASDIPDEWDLTVFNGVLAAVWEQFYRHLKTAVKMGVENQENGTMTFFEDSQKKAMEAASS